MQKECRGCHQIKPLDLFYRHRMMGDGHLNYCVECVKARVSQHRSRNLERINEYDRQRSNSPGRKQKFQELRVKSSVDPIRKRAYVTTSNAIRDGRLIRPPVCSQCGKQCKPEAHHDDYTKPLEVRWLCRSCHCRHHRLQVLQEVT